MQLSFRSPEIRGKLQGVFGEINKRHHTVSYAVQELMATATKNGIVTITWGEAKDKSSDTVKEQSRSSISANSTPIRTGTHISEKFEKVQDVIKQETNRQKPENEGIDEDVARANAKAIFGEIEEAKNR